MAPPWGSDHATSEHRLDQHARSSFFAVTELARFRHAMAVRFDDAAQAVGFELEPDPPADRVAQQGVHVGLVVRA
jgi:hypothetical protein